MKLGARSLKTCAARMKGAYASYKKRGRGHVLGPRGFGQFKSHVTSYVSVGSLSSLRSALGEA